MIDGLHAMRRRRTLRFRDEPGPLARLIIRIGAPGRVLACISPLRSRVPDTFGHRSVLGMVPMVRLALT